MNGLVRKEFCLQQLALHGDPAPTYLCQDMPDVRPQSYMTRDWLLMRMRAKRMHLDEALDDYRKNRADERYWEALHAHLLSETKHPTQTNMTTGTRLAEVLRHDPRVAAAADDFSMAYSMYRNSSREV